MFRDNIQEVLFATPAITDEIFRVHSKIEALRAKLRNGAEARRWTGFLRRVMLARAVQSSNSIEGYNVTIDDAIAAAEGEAPLDNPVIETWAAITGYRQALTYILQIADDPSFRYSQPLLSSMHFMMLQHELRKHPGRWRPGPIYIRNDETGETVYEGPPVDQVPDLMAELIDSLNAVDDVPVMVRAAMAHLNLVMIHPYSDGNGRMARALQTFVLAREGVLSPQFCSIEEYLGQYTKDYYAVLGAVGAGAWHPERDATDWVKFCLTAHFRQATKLLKRNRELGKLWSELEQIVERHDLPERTVSPLADAALGFKVRSSVYRLGAELSPSVASYDLSKLVKAGLLEPRGLNRGRHYVASPMLREIRERIREPKMAVDDPFELPSVIQPAVIVKTGQQLLPGFWLDDDT